MTVLTIKDLLGIDVDNNGLAETIENVTSNVLEMEAVHDAIGRAIFLDGAMLEDGIGILNPQEVIADIAFSNKRVMQMLCHYASNTESFMSRLKG